MENPILAILTATSNYLASEQWTQMELAGNVEQWAAKETANFQKYDGGPKGTVGILQNDLNSINHWASISSPTTYDTAKLNAAESQFNYDNTECSTINSQYSAIMQSASTMLGNIMSSLMSRVEQLFAPINTIENALQSALSQGVP
jgi:hypothetical protein